MRYRTIVRCPSSGADLEDLRLPRLSHSAHDLIFAKPVLPVTVDIVALVRVTPELEGETLVDPVQKRTGRFNGTRITVYLNGVRRTRASPRGFHVCRHVDME